MLLQVRRKLLFLYLLRSSSALATSESHAHQHHKHSISPNTSPSSPALVGHIALRVATRTDVPAIQRCNLATLPENYSNAFYVSHLRQWPELALVAEHVLPAKHNSSNKRNPFDSFDASKPQNEIVGYVLGKVEETEVSRTSSTSSSIFSKSTVSETDEYFNNYSESGTMTTTELMGHVTSLAVLPTHRRKGLAAELMEQLHFHMDEGLGASGVGLHVRVSNIAARRLYCEGMGYGVVDVIRGYYQDGEDAFFMRKNFVDTKSYDNGSDEFGASDGNGNFGEASNLSRFSLSRMRKNRSGTKRRNSGGLFSHVWECGPEEFRLPRIIVDEQGQGSIDASQGDSSSHVMTGRL
jgi:ribosomal protein S18 acetylase RimI-like enzyme